MRFYAFPATFWILLVMVMVYEGARDRVKRWL